MLPRLAEALEQAGHPSRLFGQSSAFRWGVFTDKRGPRKLCLAGDKRVVKRVSLTLTLLGLLLLLEVAGGRDRTGHADDCGVAQLRPRPEGGRRGERERRGRAGTAPPPCAVCAARTERRGRGARGVGRVPGAGPRPGACAGELDGEEVGGAVRCGAPGARAGAGHREHTARREGLETAQRTHAHAHGRVRAGAHRRNELLELVEERVDALVRGRGTGRRAPFARKVDPGAFVVAVGEASVVVLREERGPLPLLVLVPPEHPVLVLVPAHRAAASGHTLFCGDALGGFGGSARDVVLFLATLEEDGELDVLGVHRGADIGL